MRNEGRRDRLNYISTRPTVDLKTRRELFASSLGSIKGAGSKGHASGEPKEMHNP